MLFPVFSRGNGVKAAGHDALMEMTPRKCFDRYAPMISKYHVANVTLFKFLIFRVLEFQQIPPYCLLLKCGMYNV